MIAAKQKKFLLHRSLNNDSCKFVKKIYKKISESLSAIPKAEALQQIDAKQGEYPETHPVEFGNMDTR